MRTIVLSIMLLGFAASSLPLAAQDASLSREQRQAANMKLMPFIFPHIVTLQATGRTLGNMFVEYGDDPTFQEAAGTTDEQYYTFSDFMLQTREDMRPVFAPVLTRALETNDPDQLAEVAADFGAILMTIADGTLQKLNETISPEQVNRLRELEFQMMSPMVTQMGFPMINYDAYKALNLNEQQQEELEKIRLSFEREQKDFFAEWRNMFPAPGKKPTREDLQEMEKKLKAHSEGGKKLVARIQAKIVTILDRDQEKRLSELKTNIPEFVKEHLKKRGMAPKPVDEEAYQKWLESWKPGQKIPSEFREREKARRKPFPMM